MCAAELRIPSFNAHRFQTGTKGEREREAAILIENEGQFGISGVTDEGRIVHPGSMAMAYHWIDLFFNKLPQEVRMQCVHPNNSNLGYSWLGRENYGKEKERWKHFVRHNVAQGRYPESLWPDKKTLLKSTNGMDAAFIDHFQQRGIGMVHGQLDVLGTVALDALAEFYFGLGKNYFSGARRVGNKEYKLVLENTLQLIQYVNGREPELQQYLDGKTPKVGDLLFDEHADSSAGTLGDARHDTEHCLEVKVGDEWRPAVIEGGTYFFQFGKTFRFLVETLIAEGTIDANKLKYGTMKETLHRGVRRSLESQRPGIVDFIHPEATTPLRPYRMHDMVAGDVLKRDLGEYMAKAPQ